MISSGWGIIWHILNHLGHIFGPITWQPWCRVALSRTAASVSPSPSSSSHLTVYHRSPGPGGRQRRRRAEPGSSGRSRERARGRHPVRNLVPLPVTGAHSAAQHSTSQHSTAQHSTAGQAGRERKTSHTSVGIRDRDSSWKLFNHRGFPHLHLRLRLRQEQLNNSAAYFARN